MCPQLKSYFYVLQSDWIGSEREVEERVGKHAGRLGGQGKHSAAFAVEIAQLLQEKRVVVLASNEMSQSRFYSLRRVSGVLPEIIRVFSPQHGPITGPIGI